METIREWASNLTPSQKKKSTLQVIGNLLSMIKSDSSSENPDYEGWTIALTALNNRAIVAFYEQTYESLPLAAQSAINRELIEQMDKINIQRAWPRMAQAIQQRLANGEDAEVLTPELQWYIERISNQVVLEEHIKSIWKSCPVKKLMKLFSLDTTNWNIDKQKIFNFYFALVQMLQTADGKTDWNSIFTAFLEKNHLGDTENSDQMVSDLSSKEPQTTSSPDTAVEEPQSSAPLPAEPSASIPAQSTAPEKIVDVRRDTEEIAGKDHDSSTEESIAEDSHDVPPPTPQIPSAPPAEVLQAEPEQGKDGVKLAEQLLAWARAQVQGTNILKSSLKSSNSDLKRIEERFANLREELFAAKEELTSKEATITALQRDLATTQARLASEQTKSAELDGMVSKLQQMNENSAEQAVLGYKAELASALKSIVEDTRLPETRHDPEILSALLADLLDTLRFKGVPLEVDEK